MINSIENHDQPLDWIYCPDGRMKAVVACMVHCDKKCEDFWRFFRNINKTPAEYYNKNNIGELCMRRVVFDCDRCGKKDVEKVFSRYDEDTYPENKLLDEKTRAELFEESDYLYDDVGESFFQIMQIMEKEKDWRHFCDKCFIKVLGSWAQIMNIKKRGRKIVSDVLPTSDSQSKVKKSVKKTKRPEKKSAA